MSSHVSHLPAPTIPDAYPRFAGTGWSRWRVFVAAWAIYSSYRVVQLVVLKVVQPLDEPSMAIRICLGLVDGFLVGLCAIVLVAVGGRFPIERPNRARNVMINVLAAFACSVGTLSALW